MLLLEVLLLYVSSLVKDDNFRGVVLDDAVVNLLMQERGGPSIFSSSYVRLVGGVVIFVCFARCLFYAAGERERERDGTDENSENAGCPSWKIDKNKWRGSVVVQSVVRLVCFKSLCLAPSTFISDNDSMI